MKKISKTLSALALGITCAATSLMGTVQAFAASTANDVNVNDIFTEKGKDMFGETTKVVSEAGASARTLVVTIAVIVLVIGLVFIGVSLASRNTQKREQAKSSLGFTIAGAIVVFAAIAILALSQNIAASLTESVTTEQSSTPTPTPKG